MYVGQCGYVCAYMYSVSLSVCLHIYFVLCFASIKYVTMRKEDEINQIMIACKCLTKKWICFFKLVME